MWGTPRASDGEKGGPNQSFGAGGMLLPAQAAQWPTPMAGTPAQNGNSAAGNSDFTRRADMLAEQVMKAWPTPAARDWKGENGADHLQNGTGRLHMDQLPNAVAHGFTPPDLPTRQGGPMSCDTRPISRRLFRSAMSNVPQTTLRRCLRAGAWRKARLNPLFVEWLQAFPTGHALCASSAMEFTLWQRDMRSALSQLPTASGPWIWAPTDGAETAEPQKKNKLF